MSESKHPVRVDQVAWGHLFPWLRLFGAFRMAIGLSKMGLALMLLVLIFILGHGLDVMCGPRAFPREIEVYANRNTESFEQWREEHDARSRIKLVKLLKSLYLLDVKPEKMIESPDRFALARKAIHDHFNRRERQIQQLVAGQTKAVNLDKLNKTKKELRRTHRQALAAVAGMEPAGVFKVAFAYQLRAFERLVNAAVGLRFGFQHIIVPAGSASAQGLETNTVGRAIRDLVIVLPGWMYHTHRVFSIFFGIILLALFSILGGTIARLAALDATDSSHVSVMVAMRFVLRRYLWFILTPVFPALLAGFCALLLAGGGLVFFNLPVLDMLGGFLFAVALFLGFSMAMLLVLTMAGHPMFYPALVVEGTDSFDAVSRSFGYLVGRPWHWLFYSLLSLVYGAIGYIFISTLIYLTLCLTHFFVGMGVFSQVSENLGRWEALMPSPRLGQLLYDVDWYAGLGFTGKLTAGLIWVWCFFLTGIIGAYTISFYYSSNVLIYLLLRHSADKTRFDEIAMDRHEDTPEPIIESEHP